MVCRFNHKHLMSEVWIWPFLHVVRYPLWYILFDNPVHIVYEHPLPLFKDAALGHYRVLHLFVKNPHKAHSRTKCHFKGPRRKYSYVRFISILYRGHTGWAYKRKRTFYIVTSRVRFLFISDVVLSHILARGFMLFLCVVRTTLNKMYHIKSSSFRCIWILTGVYAELLRGRLSNDIFPKQHSSLIL